MKKTMIAAVFAGVAAAAVAIPITASAHVWNIGWKSTDGNLTFYGVSWHSSPVGESYDDFFANPAGFVINGTNLSFETGSTVDLNNCYGGGGLTSGTCSSVWNSLSLDGALQSTQVSTGDTYGKYSIATISNADLGLFGLGTGANSVSLTTYANNAVWASRLFSSASVPLNIVVQPPEDPSPVPLPASMSLMLAGLAALGCMRARRKIKTS